MLEKLNLLIVEDDFENQRFLQIFLKRYFNVELCDSDLSFYECLSRRKVDIVLMDISLKGDKNGLQLTRELKDNPLYMDIPVVCLSAHAYSKDRENAAEAGADIFLTKPVENNLLLNTLLDTYNKKAVLKA